MGNIEMTDLDHGLKLLEPLNVHVPAIYMSKNSSKQLYTQTVEWLKTRGVKTLNTSGKKSRFNTYKERGRK